MFAALSPSARSLRTPHRAIVVATLFAGVLASMFMFAGSASAQATASSDASSVYQTVAPSVFVVETRDSAGRSLGIGTAFLIPGGYLVTNAHVIRQGAPFLRTGAVALPLVVDRADAVQDLALLKAAVPIDAPPLRLGTSTPPIGTSIIVLGNPHGLERSISQGLISGIRQHGGRTLLQISAPISPGSSGGPVMTNDGVVVGVTVSYLEDGQNLNFAVPVSQVAALIASSSPPIADRRATTGVESSPNTTFAAAIALLRTLAATNPDWRDTVARNAHESRRLAALAAGRQAARYAAEYLALASVAQVTEREPLALQVLALTTQERTSGALVLRDSARALLVEEYEWDLLFADSLPRSRSAEILGQSDSLLARLPNHVPALTVRARTLRLAGRVPEALATAKRATDVAADSASRATAWSTYHRIAGYATASTDDAVFARMVALGQGTAFNWSIHGEHLEQREAWAAMAAAYAKAFTLQPDAWGATSWTCKAGHGYLRSADTPRALDAYRTCIAAYERATVVDSSDVGTAHRALAFLLNDRGVPAQAEVHARASLRYAPDHPFATRQLAEALKSQRKLQEALQVAEEAVRLSDGGEAAPHFTLGSIQFDLEDWAGCARSFEFADKFIRTRSNTSALYNQALCTSNQGYRRDAALLMEQVLRRDPNRADRQDILRMIARWRL
jgi:tetratricopeptide (TPR) repeat protein